jgi:hypothetical protein
MSNKKAKKETDIVPIRFHHDETGLKISGDFGHKNEDVEEKIGYHYDVEKDKLSLTAGFGTRDSVTIEPGLTHENDRWTGSLNLYMSERILRSAKKYAMLIGGLITVDTAYEMTRLFIEKYSAQLSSEYKIGLPIAVGIITGVAASYGINRFFKNKIRKIKIKF